MKEAGEPCVTLLEMHDIKVRRKTIAVCQTRIPIEYPV